MQHTESEAAGYEPASYWHTTSDQPPTPDDLPRSTDVAVVGGGLLGAATAYWLARAGAAPVLVERGALAQGATGRNGGFVVAGTAEPYPAAIARLGHATARAVWSLTLDSRDLLRQVLAEEQIACGYREPGHLGLALGAEQLTRAAQTAAALQADGFAAEPLDRAQVEELIGTPLGPEIAGGIFAPENGLIHPARLVQGLANAARRRGARIATGVEVVRLGNDGGGVLLETTRGTLRAGAAVVAGNAWTGQIVPELGKLVTPVRGQVLAYAPIEPVFRVGLSAAVTPTGEYWQQTPDGTIVLGGCRALAPGMDVGTRESRPTDEVQSALEQVLLRLFPALAGLLRVRQRWAGPMAFTPDYLPIADQAPSLAGVWVVGGFSGHGMPFGMRLGQLLAQAAIEGTPPAALAPFRLDRPTLR